MTKTALITGTSRGIGLGLAQLYLAKGYRVFAAARCPDASRDLWEMERDFGARVKLLKLDVTVPADVEEAAKALGDQPIDLLIHNAGVLPKDVPFTQVSDADMTKALDVNVLGPLRLTRRLLANLRAVSKPTVAAITSRMGSVADNTSGRYYAYRASKAALNMTMKSFAVDHPGIMTVLIHPGWVQTDMGGQGATVTIEESVRGIATVLDGMSAEQTGRFFDFRGKEVPW